MTSRTEERSVQWRSPAAGLALVGAVVGAILALTPPAESDSGRDRECRAEVTATGPLPGLCSPRG